MCARSLARTASTRAISYFAFRCYSEIVANRPARNRWPVRCFPPHLSRSSSAVPAISSLPFLPFAWSTKLPASWFPSASYPTRCFINENEGASYIFLTRGVGPALVPHPSFFPSRISSLRHYCFHFPRRSHRRSRRGAPRTTRYARSLPPYLLPAVTSTIARGSNITFRIPDRPPGNATTSSARN